MRAFIVEIDFPYGQVLRLEVQWSGTDTALQDLYRKLYPETLSVVAWENK